MRNRKLELEKQRLRLAMKEQEYEMKKAVLDVKNEYSLANFASNLTVKLLNQDETGDNFLLTRKHLKAKRRKRTNKLHLIEDFLWGLFTFVEAYISQAEIEQAGNNKKLKHSDSSDRYDKYIIGEDDL